MTNQLYTIAQAQADGAAEFERVTTQPYELTRLQDSISAERFRIEEALKNKYFWALSDYRQHLAYYEAKMAEYLEKNPQYK